MNKAAEDQVVAGFEDSFCFKGHKMVFLDKNPYKGAVAIWCDKCKTHIDIAGFYFNCSTC